jgi:hypothetical protein
MESQLGEIMIHLRGICSGIPGQCNDSTITSKSDRGGIPQSFQDNPTRSPFQSREARKATTGTLEDSKSHYLTNKTILKSLCILYQAIRLCP